MIAVYNDLKSVECLMEESNDQVAAVIVEPVGANTVSYTHLFQIQKDTAKGHRGKFSEAVRKL